MTERTITIRIAIDIPVDIAADTLAKLTPALSAIAPQPAPVQVEQEPDPVPTIADAREAERRAAELNVYEENRRRYLRNCVQAYRTYRRTAALYASPHTPYRVIADQYDWPVSVAYTAVASRKKQVNQYIRRRRLLSAFRLATDGWTNQQIGDYLGVSQPTANRLVREARERLREVGHV